MPNENFIVSISGTFRTLLYLGKWRLDEIFVWKLICLGIDAVGASKVMQMCHPRIIICAHNRIVNNCITHYVYVIPQMGVHWFRAVRFAPTLSHWNSSHNNGSIVTSLIIYIYVCSRQSGNIICFSSYIINQRRRITLSITSYYSTITRSVYECINRYSPLDQSVPAYSFQFQCKHWFPPTYILPHYVRASAINYNAFMKGDWQRDVHRACGHVNLWYIYTITVVEVHPTLRLKDLIRIHCGGTAMLMMMMLRYSIDRCTCTGRCSYIQ